MLRTKIRIASALSVLLTALTLLAACGSAGNTGSDNAASRWTVTTVVSGDVGRRDLALVADSSGELHAVYVRDSTGELVYLEESGSSWQSSPTGISSLDWDFYVDGTIRKLVYLENPPSGDDQAWYAESTDSVNWTVGEILSKPTLYDVSADVDSSGTSHAAYSFTGYDLGYAKGTGAVWNTEVVDSTISDIDTKTDLAISPDDTPHISYIDYGESPRAMRVISDPGTASAVVHDVDTTGETNYLHALDAGPGDSIHVVYHAFGSPGDEIRYGAYDGSSWTVRKVADVGSPGRPDIAVDDSGVVHLTYVDDSSEKLHYARFDGNWLRETIPTETAEPGHPAVALDGNGIPHVLYVARSSTEPKLVLARLDGTL